MPPVVPPAEHIREEMVQLEWDVGDLANYLKITEDDAAALLDGRLAVSEQIAAGLATAFGTSAQLWLNLQAAYDEAVKL